MKIISVIGISLFCLLSNIAFASNGSGWKIAIIDTGIMSDQSGAISRTSEQLCWSAIDIRTEFKEFEQASTCTSGAQNDLTSI